jgi:pimeloyl-ACP methyl ester carboxylesterase
MTRAIEDGDDQLATHVFDPGSHRGDALMIHGYTGSKEDFADVGPLLAWRGYRVVTYDQRGQHESPHSPREDAYSIVRLASDAIDLADRYELSSPHLLGHSFGGLVAQRAAVIAPRTWASLTLLCSGPHGRPGLPDLIDMIDVLSVHTMAEAWGLRFESDPRSRSRYDLLKRRWLRSDPRSVTSHARELLSAPSIVGSVRETGIRSHVLYGEQDDAWPLATQDQMALELGAPRTIIPGAGHCPNEDRPMETATVIADFWDLPG